MHIPPYYKRPAMQRFLAGVCLGTIVGYILFIYMFGELQEKWIEENLTLRAELQELNQTYETLVKSHKELDEQTKDGLVVNEIEIEFLNLRELKLETDRLMVHKLEEAIRTEANHAIGKKVIDIANSIDLLINTIENKTINIDDFRYHAEVSRIIVNEKVKFSIKLKIGT
ncbi:hypothetical protein JCM21714_2007 [Gracilibacillus boraciitolerans JCM 21714]|uniref:Sporulation membrane protein YtrI C-terminal domain-containing protein n=1 Tax=Gracilibacillus boraciitolerans JCM 21714 TaxID=1298598 RepID=W4VJJ3_9BACI|nr:sporulation membrane protein YtrI [Gracilibacillus boraciitolerans]GAE92978.1 hypothetical protein JCM21714_2007 [Gracilibacillus boraciitolerans JCM 21714]